MDDFKGLGNDFAKYAFNYAGAKINHSEALDLALAWEIRYGDNERAKVAFEILNDKDKFWSLYDRIVDANFGG